jgi:hypothetical protein
VGSFFFFPPILWYKKIREFCQNFNKSSPIYTRKPHFPKNFPGFGKIVFFWEIESKFCLFWDYSMTGRMFNPVDKSEDELWSWRLILSLLCSFWAARERKCSLSVVVLHSLFSVCSSSVFSASFLPSFLPISFLFISNRNAYLHSPESVLHSPSSSWFFWNF